MHVNMCVIVGKDTFGTKNWKKKIKTKETSIWIKKHKTKQCKLCSCLKTVFPNVYAPQWGIWIYLNFFPELFYCWGEGALHQSLWVAEVGCEPKKAEKHCFKRCIRKERNTEKIFLNQYSKPIHKNKTCNFTPCILHRATWPFVLQQQQQQRWRWLLFRFPEFCHTSSKGISLNGQLKRWISALEPTHLFF